MLPEDIFSYLCNVASDLFKVVSDVFNAVTIDMYGIVSSLHKIIVLCVIICLAWLIVLAIRAGRKDKKNLPLLFKIELTWCLANDV